MTELSFQGVEDGCLKLVDDQGEQFTLPVTEDVFAAVRRVRSHAVTGHAAGGNVRPKVIQAMIRSGMTAEDVAADTGAPLEQVRQYEGPVISERRHIAHQAGLAPVYTGDSDARPLAEIVDERLALRDVTDSRWDAWRTDTGAWHVELSFEVADRTNTASWEYRSGSVTPLDDEARWLSDASRADSGPIPDYGTPDEHVFNMEADHAARDARDPQSETGRILESLRRRKNETQPIMRAVPNAPQSEPDGAHTALSRPEDAQDDTMIAAPAPGGGYAGETAGTAGSGAAGSFEVAKDEGQNSLAHDLGFTDPDQPSLLNEPGVSDGSAGGSAGGFSQEAEPKKKGRSSVPTWDEIMFGKKD